jgi:YVTN family beta-propeller protein
MAIGLYSCTWRKAELEKDFCAESGFPEEIGRIFITRCATSGCHNPQSKYAAANLDCSSWDALMNGTIGGSAVIPFSPEQSFLINFIITDSSLGIPQKPTMPYNPLNPEAPDVLPRSDVLKIIQWIRDGAPDCHGRRLTDNPDRDKFYVINQGCDLLYVFDAQRKVIMRSIRLGAVDQLIENPHMIRFSPDKKHYYVSFVAGRYFQKFRAADDQFIGQVDITLGAWNTFAFTPDSKWAYIIDFNSPGRIAVVNCETMTLASQFSVNPFNPDPGTFNAPHGSAISPDGKYLYVTMQLGNSLFKLDISVFPPDGYYIQFPTAGIAKPHEIAFSPNGDVYFVTCQGTHDVKVFNASTDQYLSSIPTPADPVEMAFSPAKKHLYVTCMQSNSLAIIDYSTRTKIKELIVGYEPHGIDVDEKRSLVYIACRNTGSNGGPPPHHVSSCGGRNGYLVALDQNTLELKPSFKHELSVDPYGVAVRKP